MQTCQMTACTRFTRPHDGHPVSPEHAESCTIHCSWQRYTHTEIQTLANSENGLDKKFTTLLQTLCFEKKADNYSMYHYKSTRLRYARDSLDRTKAIRCPPSIPKVSPKFPYLQTVAIRSSHTCKATKMFD